uniref:Ubiquitin-like domain-containing protein n=1 Tax=Rhodosorus marinus TaxID=101924 RepID=A0A7S0G0M6_9RHOD|mmetsp:Transcript_11980/g.17343  ORF Transcript_11980/g.17343 Transcript_11980/m.17343 type:complete len:234 (+) Transcript_11980:183-884(+)
MKINIKSSTGDKFTIDVESKSETISEFKGRLAELSSIPKDAQRLIFRGHVLKDNQTIQELIDNHKMEDGHTMHLVRGTMPSGNAGSTGAAATTPGAPGTTPNQAGTAQPGMGGMPDFSNGGNMFSPENMMMPNGMTPESLGQLMDSPLMRTLTDNPELVRQMILSNPQLQQFREQNPEIAQLFNNPETFVSTAIQLQPLTLSKSSNARADLGLIAVFGLANRDKPWKRCVIRQ